MSETVVEGTAEQAADRIMALLREYSEKLDRMVERMLTSAGKPQGERQTAETEMLRDRVRHLGPAVFDLTRRASQLIQFGKVSESGKLELRLRGAEVEDLIMRAQQLAATLA